MQQGKSVYDPLKEYLSGRSESVIKMTFVEIERVLGHPLPASARKYTAWWPMNRADPMCTVGRGSMLKGAPNSLTSTERLWSLSTGDE